MQREINKAGEGLFALLGRSLIPQHLFFDGGVAKNEEIHRNYIVPYLQQAADGNFAARRAAEAGEQSFANFRAIVADAIRELGLPEDGEDARRIKEAYNAFDAAVCLATKPQAPASARDDVEIHFFRFLNAINNIARNRDVA